MKPRSVAVIGASRDPASMGNSVVKSIQDWGFTGDIYPINPKATEILGLKAYPDIGSVPSTIDVASILIPTQFVKGAVEACANKGVKGVVIYSAGFAETGEQGLAAQNEIKELARERGLRILGPNINGYFNVPSKLNLTFNQFKYLPGPVSLVSQSGALASAIIFRSTHEGIGFNKFIAVGNQADVTEIDALEYLENDPSTKLIAMYIEGLSDGRRFLSVAKRIVAKKPLIVIKVGIGEAGQRATMSHTASIAGSDAIYDAAFKSLGIIRVSGLEELIYTLLTFTTQPIPRGNRVATMTNAGGLGNIATDSCEKEGLVFPSLTQSTKDEFFKHAPKFASAANPVDLTGMADFKMYKATLTAVLKDENIDSVIVNANKPTFLGIEEFMNAWIENISVAKELGKPLLACHVGGSWDDVQKIHSTLRRKGLPAFQAPEIAAKILSHLVAYGESTRKTQS